MGKFILTMFMKLPLMFKGLSVAFVSILEAIVRSVDNIGYHIFNPLRAIRFTEVREFLSENAITISLIIIFMVLVYVTFSRRVN
jgi:hypothetical protein